jgi:hypothetical protein
MWASANDKVPTGKHPNFQDTYFLSNKARDPLVCTLFHSPLLPPSFVLFDYVHVRYGVTIPIASKLKDFRVLQSRFRFSWAFYGYLRFSRMLISVYVHVYTIHPNLHCLYVNKDGCLLH